MTHTATHSAEWRDEEISLFAVGSTLLRNRWRILGWMLLGGVIAGASVISRKPTYKATASFIPETGNQGRSPDLASLAGQFGVSIPSGGASQSPDFYVELLQSHALLKSIVRDTFTVQEMGGRRVAFDDLFEIHDASPSLREDHGVETLQGMVKPTIRHPTGIVEVAVTTPWPSVSVAIASAAVNAVNDFNQNTRRSQAAAERKFVETQLAEATDSLRRAENQLQTFLEGNRSYGNAPQLEFERGRLQRDVAMQQQMYTSLKQAYADVRMREVRDTPVITPFETPVLPTRAEARGRLKIAALGAFVGALIGLVLTFVSEMFKRSRESGNPEAREFVGTLQEVRGEMLRPVRWVAGRDRR